MDTKTIDYLVKNCSSYLQFKICYVALTRMPEKFKLIDVVNILRKEYGLNFNSYQYFTELKRARLIKCINPKAPRRSRLFVLNLPAIHRSDDTRSKGNRGSKPSPSQGSSVWQRPIFLGGITEKNSTKNSEKAWKFRIKSLTKNLRRCLENE